MTITETVISTYFLNSRDLNDGNIEFYIGNGNLNK